jgi:hypothetical protein
VHAGARHGFRAPFPVRHRRPFANINIDQIADEEFNKTEQDLDILNREILAAWKSVK